MDCLNNEQALNSQLTSNSDSISNTLNSGDVVSSTLDTTDRITSTLSSNDNTTSQMGNEEPLNSVLDQPTIHKYVGGSTDNIIVEVDNVGRIITATLKPIRFKTVADFPVVGSDKLIYIDASNNSLYSWDSATQTYSQLVAGGGGGESYDDTELRNLITGLEESKASKTEVAETLSSAKGYTDTKVAELIDSAPETLDTFKEIADALKEDQDVLDTLNSAIGNKADKTALATTDAKVGALETDNATNKADIKELQENKADADDIPTNYVTTDTIQEVTGLKSFNDVQIKGTLMDNAGTRFNSLGMIQPKLTAGRGISIEGNTISSTAEGISVKDQNSVALKPYSGSGANVTENKDALTERAIATALPYINGSHKYTDAVDIYAPTSSGKTGQILVAKSSSNVFGGWEEKTSGGTPEWKDVSELGLLTEDNAVFMPVGMIFQSAIPINDARVHALDGSTVAIDGIYADFVNYLKQQQAKGYNLYYTNSSDYETDLSTCGQCGRFLLNQTLNTLRFPMVKYFTEGVGSLTDIGSALEAGLPNITGYVGWEKMGYLGGASSEALYFKDSIGGWNAESGGSAGWNTAGVGIDASRSNPIYGKSTTVQPQAIRYPYYIVVANGYKSNEQVNIDNVISDLSLVKSRQYKFYKFPNINISTSSPASAELTISTKGRPVYVSLTGDINPLYGGAWTMIYLYRNGTMLASHCIQSTGDSVNVPFVINYLDIVSSGTYTYKITFEVGAGTIDLAENTDAQTPNFTVFEI